MAGQADACDCSSRGGTVCLLGAALRCGRDEAWRDAPLYLTLTPGNYSVPVETARLLDGRLVVSSISLAAAVRPGVANAVGGADHAVWLASAVSLAEPVLSILGGSPPVTLQGVNVRGRLLISSDMHTPHTIRGCIFDGVQIPEAAGAASAASERRLLDSSVQGSAPVALEGGGIAHVSGALAIEDVIFRHLRSESGGALSLRGPNATAHVSSSVFEYNEAEEVGGAISVTDGAKLTLSTTLMRGNVAGLQGGGIFAAGSSVILHNGSKLSSNTVRQPGRGHGSTYLLSHAAQMFYILPTPPAHYVTLTRDCRADSVGACPTDAGWAASLQSFPELDGVVSTQVLETVYDGDYPFPCSPGLYGVEGVVDDQRSPDCTGRCPAGFKCDVATVDPLPCEKGTYCSVGTGALATPCAGGTWSNITKLKRSDGCHNVTAGYYSAAGSSIPTVRIFPPTSLHAIPCARAQHSLPRQLASTRALHTLA